MFTLVKGTVIYVKCSTFAMKHYQYCPIIVKHVIKMDVFNKHTTEQNIIIWSELIFAVVG